LKAHKQLPVLRAALLRHQQAVLADQAIDRQSLAAQSSPFGACHANFNRQRDYPGALKSKDIVVITGVKALSLVNPRFMFGQSGARVI